jgi:hypothetical protein
MLKVSVVELPNDGLLPSLQPTTLPIMARQIAIFKTVSIFDSVQFIAFSLANVTCTCFRKPFHRYEPSLCPVDVFAALPQGRIAMLRFRAIDRYRMKKWCATEMRIRSGANGVMVRVR